MLEVEQATFKPFVFNTMGGMAVECKWYHSRHAELVATKKGENCVMNSGKSIIALLKSALLGLRGSRGSTRVKLELLDIDSILRELANIH